MVDSVTSSLSTFDRLQAEAEAATAQQQEESNSTTSDYEDFLLLMTTQMQNQDPLKPMDSTEFVSQLAQFSGVEQQVNMNQKLDQLLTTLGSSELDQAALYLGRSITSDTGKFIVQNNQAPAIDYQFPSNASAGHINIYDRAGQLADSYALPLGSGPQTTNWQPQEDEFLSNGLYRAELVFQDFQGNEISRAFATTKNRVTEIQKTEAGFNLKTETGDLLNINDVTAIAE